MKNAILIIDTSSNLKAYVALSIDGEKYEEIKELDRRKAQVVLPMIDDLLQKHNLSLSDISKIEVNTGPGSFTGLRVGVSIANTLAAILKIPVNSLPIGELAEPQYS